MMPEDEVLSLRAQLEDLQDEFDKTKAELDRQLKLAFEENNRLSIEINMITAFNNRLLDVIEGAISR